MKRKRFRNSRTELVAAYKVYREDYNAEKKREAWKASGKTCLPAKA